MPTSDEVPEPDPRDPRPGWGPPPGGWDSLGLPSTGPEPLPPLQPPAKPGVVELRPLGFGDLLDATFAVVRLAPIPTLLNAVLAQLLPALTAMLLLYPLVAGIEVSIGPDLPAPTDWLQGIELSWGAYATGIGAYLAAQLLAGVLVVAPSTVAAMRATLGLRTGWGLAMARGARALARLAAWNLLAGAAVMLAAVLWVAAIVAGWQSAGPAAAVGLLLLGGLLLPLYVWLAIKLCFVPTEIVARSLGIGSAMASSWRLVRGSWWRILGILLVISIILGLLSGLVVQVLGVLSGQFLEGGDDLPLAVGVGFATQAVVGALSMVLGQIMLTLLHVDVRIRHERLDLVLEEESRRGHAHPIPGHAARGAREHP